MDEAFEVRLARLEAISEELRSGKLGIEDALKKYEEGVGLSTRLQAELRSVEQRVEILMQRATEQSKGLDEPLTFQKFDRISDSDRDEEV